MVQSQRLDRTFAALADPTRRDILERLSTGPASVTELATPLDISLPGVMKHIHVLEGAGLVTSQKLGRTRECRVVPGDMDDAQAWIERYRRRWEGRLDRLGAIVERKQKAKGARS